MPQSKNKLYNKIKEKNVTAENTINEMFISNINIESKSKNGEKIFNYKNIICSLFIFICKTKF